MAPNVTIITVNLNNEAGLRRTLESIFLQSYTNYEVNVIDGGSSDGSYDILSGYSQKINYWVSEKDSGIYNAMNKGIKKANGEYCLFLNSGDWFINGDVLNTVFSKAHAADLITANCQISKAGQVVYVAKPGKELTLKSFVKNTIPHQSTFIKRSLFEKFGLYNEVYRLHADYDFWIRAIILGQCTVENVDLVLVDYNLDGLSSDVENNPHLHQEAYDILTGYFPNTILRDYYTWLEDKTGDYVVVDWIRSKAIIYTINTYLYKVVKRLKFN